MLKTYLCKGSEASGVKSFFKILYREARQAAERVLSRDGRVTKNPSISLDTAWNTVPKSSEQLVLSRPPLLSRVHKISCSLLRQNVQKYQTSELISAMRSRYAAREFQGIRQTVSAFALVGMATSVQWSGKQEFNWLDVKTLVGAEDPVKYWQDRSEAYSGTHNTDSDKLKYSADNTEAAVDDDIDDDDISILNDTSCDDFIHIDMNSEVLSQSSDMMNTRDLLDQLEASSVLLTNQSIELTRLRETIAHLHAGLVEFLLIEPAVLENTDESYNVSDADNNVICQALMIMMSQEKQLKELRLIVTHQNEQLLMLSQEERTIGMKSSYCQRDRSCCPGRPPEH